VVDDQSLSRRKALIALAAVPVAVALGAPALIGLRRKSGASIVGDFVSDGSDRGHALRDRTSASGSRVTQRVSVVVIGAGISGLAAAWRLQSRGVIDLAVLELGDEAGGNARSGENAVSRFPWGAHYLPVPSANAAIVREVCREFGLLTGDVWDERALVAAPEERLFIHGRWVAGIEPTDALSVAERAEHRRFRDEIAEWKATGEFTVPSVTSRGAKNSRSRTLDTQSMRAWMDARGFSAPLLRWYVEYGMRDDYGASLDTASAWAGVHYFAARDDDAATLTWPEGNSWLVQRFMDRVGTKVRTKTPVLRVAREGWQWVVETPDTKYVADAVVSAIPSFVLSRVLDGVAAPPAPVERSPWLVANLTLHRAPDELTYPLAWDNVMVDSPSLGYVAAKHQSLSMPDGRNVWTWYRALHDQPVVEARRSLRDRSWSSWRDEILSDLRRAHPDIDSCVSRIDIQRYAHAMPRPVPGFLAASAALRAWTPGERFAFAHSDASGLSLFEESLERGVAAADAIAGALVRA
jgi:protoporphyrinogen oxidase